jgi:hypothetical protein
MAVRKNISQRRFNLPFARSELYHARAHLDHLLSN